MKTTDNSWPAGREKREDGVRKTGGGGKRGDAPELSGKEREMPYIIVVSQPSSRRRCCQNPENYSENKKNYFAYFTNIGSNVLLKTSLAFVKLRVVTL